MTTDARLPAGGEAKRPTWRDPHQLAGRSMIADVVLGLLIVIGALADTVAFKTTLDILLRQSEVLSWVMAAGATCLALVTAARLGIAIAIRRRDDSRYASLTIAVAAVPWLGLGLAMFITRLMDVGSAGPAFGAVVSQSTQPTTLIAIFFGAVYLISGACTMVEAARLHNPEAALYRQLGKRLDRQVARTAAAEASMVRAQEAVQLHDSELEREEARRHAAVVARRALGAEAASHARIRMAALLSDPSKTGITETRPGLPPAVSPPALPMADDGRGGDPDSGNGAGRP